MLMSIYYKLSLSNALTMILIVHIFLNVNKLCLNERKRLNSNWARTVWVGSKCYFEAWASSTESKAEQSAKNGLSVVLFVLLVLDVQLICSFSVFVGCCRCCFVFNGQSTVLVNNLQGVLTVAAKCEQVRSRGHLT